MNGGNVFGVAILCDRAIGDWRFPSWHNDDQLAIEEKKFNLNIMIEVII